MTCPNCGMEMPEGSVSCPACGYQAAPAPAYDTTPAYSPAPAKKNTGAIIGIIIGVIVVIAAVVAVLVIFVFGGKGKTNGKYVCETFAAFGMDCYLEVDGDNVELVMSYDANGDGTISSDEEETSEGTIKFDGDVCTITIEGESLDCPYDKKEGTITMSDESMMGMELVFTKEK